MEFIAILFIIITVFNVINTAIQKARQSGPAQPARVVRKTRPQGLGENRDRPRRGGAKRLQAPAEPEWSGEGETLMWRGEDIKAAPPLQQVDGESDTRAAAVSGSLARILRDPDNLVAAFIFHEIMDRPLSLRRR